jgi:hypothetical protein
MKDKQVQELNHIKEDIETPPPIYFILLTVPLTIIAFMLCEYFLG